jgi:hypothetical protein
VAEYLISVVAPFVLWCNRRIMYTRVI